MYVVMDKDGNLWGPFDGAISADYWATKKWPRQPHYDERPAPREGWSIVAIRPAD